MALRVTYGEPGKMNQLMQLMGYDWLSKQRHKRSLDYLQKQREGMEEYQTRGAELLETGRVAEHGRLTERALQKFLQDIAKKPEIERLVSLSQYIETQPGIDPGQLEQLNQVIGNKTKEYARASSALLSENIAGIDNTLLANAIKEVGAEEYGRIARAGVTARTAEEQRKLSREKLALEERKEIRVGREKVEGTQKEYYTHIKSMGNRAVDYLKGLKVEIGALSPEEQKQVLLDKISGTGQLDKAKKLMAGVISAGNLAKVITKINKLIGKSRTGRLTPEEEDYIYSSFDIFKRQEEAEHEELAMGGELYREAPPQLPRTPEEIAGLERRATEEPLMPAAEPMVSDEEKVATLTRMILEEAAMANKDISPEEAERRARAALGIR